MENISAQEPQDLQDQQDFKAIAENINNFIQANADAGVLNSHDEAIQCFYHGIGQMTRLVHSATRRLDELYNDVNDPEILKHPHTNFLRYVKSITASATSDVLDHLEASAPIIEKSIEDGDQLSEDIALYQKSNQSSDEPLVPNQLLHQVQAYLEQNATTMGKLSDSHSEILILQSYQDLTAQAITKAEHLLNNVESTLAELLKSFSNIQHMERFMDDSDIAAVNTDTLAEESAGADAVVSEQLAQDDVDALLSELGF